MVLHIDALFTICSLRAHLHNFSLNEHTGGDIYSTRCKLILLRKGQKLVETVMSRIAEIVNQNRDPMILEVWGEDYSVEKELIVPNR